MTSAPGPARRRLAIATLVVVLLVAMMLAVGLGAVHITPGKVVGAITRGLSGSALGKADAVILDLRLPRVILAALVGAALALAGVLYQALFKNPLADPYILGVSAGAGLGATIALVTVGTSFASRAFGVPAGAFAGALLTIAFVIRLASRAGRADTTSLLLAGVAISYTLAAITSFLLVVFRNSMQSVVFWMMGGLTSASWDYVGVVAAMFAVGAVLPALYSRELNIMLLGDERAGQLGVNVERFKLLVLASASLVVAAAVSVSGLIGFVGLMTPHMARLVLGPDHKLLLPASTLAGAIVMVLADLAARTVLAPVEIPVGIVTAVLGGPFFVWLLVRKKERR
ncbi:MAG: iron ABC transporter permease [Coriobacteriia bacterium]|nr:iron ABC transporter permease [Coriobacteriia bacterium]